MPEASFRGSTPGGDRGAPGAARDRDAPRRSGRVDVHHRGRVALLPFLLRVRERATGLSCDLRGVAPALNAGNRSREQVDLLTSSFCVALAVEPRAKVIASR